MTQNLQTPRIEYLGDGVTTVFAFEFTSVYDSTIQVIVDQTQLQEGVDYDLINMTSFGGEVQFYVAPDDQSKVLIQRFTPMVQQVDLEPFSEFPADTIEWSYDRIVRILQEMAAGIQDTGTGTPQFVLSVFGRVGHITAFTGDYAALQITYDPSVSGLSATNVQAAIDEVNANSNQIAANLAAHIADLANPHEVMHAQLTDVSPTDINPHGNNRWMGGWIQQEYVIKDQVLDQDWLMIANKTTQDRAAPQPTGSPEWILPTAPTWDPQAYTGVVYTGLRILPDAGRLIAVTEVRVWLPDVTINSHYRVVTIDLISDAVTTGSPFLGNVLVAPGWYTVNVPSEFIQGGDDVAVVLESYNSAATTDFNHPWRYTGSTQAVGDPGTGNINHNNQQTVLRINDTDNDAVDRTAQLASVVPGTIIRVAEEGNPTAYLEYQVLISNGFATWHDYNVTLLDTGSTGPLPATRCTVSFQVPVAALTDYVRIVGQYIGDPVLFGYLAFDTITGGTFNDVAYGIDVQYQEYVASADWDYQAFSGAAGGSASARQSRSITQSRTWFERWLPTELDRLADGIQGEKWQPGPPPDNATVLRLNQFLIYASAPTVNLGRSRLWQALEWLELIGILDPGRAVILIEP